MRTSQGREYQPERLDPLIEQRRLVTLGLRGGGALHGRILAYDAYTFVLAPADDTPPVLVYKAWITSLSPQKPVRRGARGQQDAIGIEPAPAADDASARAR